MKRKEYENAIVLYSQAIALQPCAAFYGNRAAALSNARRFEEAVDDCNSALLLDPSYTKAYTRLSSALHELGRHTEA